MSKKNASGAASPLWLIGVVALSILWVFVRPDLWLWSLGFAAISIYILEKLEKARERRLQLAIESARNQYLASKGQLKEKTNEEAQLEAIEALMAGANLFAYERNHDLIPHSDFNPLYGVMDFDEWEQWKQREYERTGNPWFNHPNGLPPK